MLRLALWRETMHCMESTLMGCSCSISMYGGVFFFFFNFNPHNSRWLILSCWMDNVVLVGCLWLKWTNKNQYTTTTSLWGHNYVFFFFFICHSVLLSWFQTSLLKKTNKEKPKQNKKTKTKNKTEIFGKDLNKLSALGENSHTLNFRHVAHVFIRRNPMLLWGLLTSLWPWWRQSEESII